MGRKCCFCGTRVKYGNDPAPLRKKGYCCDDCNTKLVLPARLALQAKQKIPTAAFYLKYPYRVDYQNNKNKFIAGIVQAEEKEEIHQIAERLGDAFKTKLKKDVVVTVGQPIGKKFMYDRNTPWDAKKISKKKKNFEKGS